MRPTAYRFIYHFALVLMLILLAACNLVISMDTTPTPIRITQIVPVTATPAAGVVVATPVSTHFELARQALLRDKHVLVEKPLTASSEQARELVALAPLEAAGLEAAGIEHASQGGDDA